jgi:CRP/FNR family transcriptional regulator
MDRYLNKTNCHDCAEKDSCFFMQTEKELEFHKKIKKHITFKKGETIVKEGTQVGDILYIIDGLVKVYIEGSDKNIIIKILKANEFIGFTSLFGDNTYYFSAASLTDCEVCLIDSESIKELISECCKFARELSAWYCKNYNVMLSKCMNLGLRQLNGKMANTLLYLSGKEFEGFDVFTHISRTDLAELSGMSMESVVRLLSEFKQDGIIDLKGKKIIIKDMEKLHVLNRKG